MELILNGFQSDLSSISSEIQTLQQQSVAMNQRLKNRQAVRGELSQFVDEMVVPESMIKCVPLFILFTPFLPLGEAIASRAVFVIVSGSDGRTETLFEPAK